MPVITLKSLKYAAFASEETHCFEATVYVNGVRFCYARNDGRGGCDMYDPIKITPGCGPKLDKDIGLLNAAIKKERAAEWETHKRHDGSTFDMGPDFEWAVNEAVTNTLIERDLKAALRRKWMYQKPDAPALWEIKKRPGQTTDGIMAALTKTHGDIVLLNALSDREALDIYMVQT